MRNDNTIYDSAMEWLTPLGKSLTDIIHIGNNDYYLSLDAFKRVFGDEWVEPEEGLTVNYCRGLVIMFSDDSWLEFIVEIDPHSRHDRWFWGWEYRTKPQINPFATKITSVW